MKIIDTHCDALWKLQRTNSGAGANGVLDFQDSPHIDTNAKRLKLGGVKVQFFAVFIPSAIPSNEMWQHALEQIDLFFTEVIHKNKNIKHIKRYSDILKLKDDEIGAVLTLEGADCIGNDLVKLRILYYLGVLAIGLTWNNANLCADGVGESRGAGLSEFGKKVVSLNNSYKVLTDLSHLSEQAVWDVLEHAQYLFASHSNARAVCDHPRNLSDDVILEMIRQGAPLHLVFHPPFINQGKKVAEISDIIRHIDHVCSLGGEEILGFGSDFDGIDYYVNHLENAANYPDFINELLKYYSETQVKAFASENFKRYVKRIL